MDRPVTSPKEIIQEMKKELAKPFDEIDTLHLLALSVNLASLRLGIEAGRQAMLELRRGGLLSAVRSLLAGRGAHDRQLANITLDPEQTERRCSRIEQLRSAYTILFGLTEPVRKELVRQEASLEEDARGSYTLVRPLVAVFPRVGETLKPATDYFVGPARRGAHTRRRVKTAVDKTRTEERARDEGTAPPTDDSLLSLAAAPAGARRSRKR